MGGKVEKVRLFVKNKKNSIEKSIINKGLNKLEKRKEKLEESKFKETLQEYDYTLDAKTLESYQNKLKRLNKLIHFLNEDDCDDFTDLRLKVGDEQYPDTLEFITDQILTDEEIERLYKKNFEKHYHKSNIDKDILEKLSQKGRILQAHLEEVKRSEKDEAAFLVEKLQYRVECYKGSIDLHQNSLSKQKRQP